ncbi:MAG: 50S ribosomal protein L29 [Bdellovibrionales bacterium]|nr:50S ribosomal protein L29 [Bdellovibrionales bacterium]
MKEFTYRKEMLESFRSMAVEEILNTIEDYQTELSQLSFKNKSGQLENTAQIKKARKVIAQLKTLLKEKQKAL